MRAQRAAGDVRSSLFAALLACAGLLVPAPGAAQTDPAADPVTEPLELDETPSVSVLPFRVNSARPIEYLGESISNLIRTRLEESGRLQVGEPGAGEVPVSDAALRELAASLSVDYAVTGSVTELAGRYSLDVRITPATLGLRGHTLVVTAEDDDELLERVTEVSQGIVEYVTGAARARVVRVDFEGVEGVDQVVGGRLRTRVGEAYDAEAVRDDIALLRGQPGVTSASVETEREDDGGVVVRFRLVGAERAFGAAPPEIAGRQVAEVRVRGNRRVEAGAIRARMRTQEGGPYSASQVADDVRDIYGLGFFRDVAVFTEDTTDGIVVTIQVVENPIVRQISISGNENLGGDQIRDILTLTTGSTLDYPLLFENRERIESLYRAQGYYLAEVESEIERLSEAAVGINFHVEENKKLRLTEIRFNGIEHFTQRELRQGFQTKPWRFWSYATSWFDNSGTYSEPLFLQDLKNVSDLYSNAGFLQVEVGEPTVIPAEEGLTVTVDIVEGRRFRVGTIEITGDESVDTETLVEKLQLQEGEIFNRSFLTEDVAGLTQHYADRGFYFANVDPLSNLAEKTETVDVQYQVRKGPLYFIREVDIAGNTTTIDPVIRREVQLVEGQLYSQRAVLLSRARIQRLGFFEEVDFQPQPTAEKDQLDLEINVVERPTGSFSFGAGFSSQDQLVVTGSLSQQNLFGRGYAVQLSADVGGRSQRFFLSFQDPYFLGTDFSLGTTIFNTTVRFEDFDQDQTGADVVLGHALTEDNRTRGFLRYSFARREIDEDINVNAASIIFRDLLQGRETTSLLGLSFSSDTRDDRLAPTSGFQLAGSIEGAGIGGFSKFLRIEGRGAYFLPAPKWLLDRSTFVFSTRVGYALPFNDIGDYDLIEGATPAEFADGNVDFLSNLDEDLELPLTERYFLGGLGQFQLRGFKARSVGPRRAILTSINDPDTGQPTGQFIPVNRKFAQNPDTLNDDSAAPLTTICAKNGTFFDENGFERSLDPAACNDIDDEDEDDFEELGDTDVIGGNKFISSSIEYRFPVSEALGLQGLLFLDMGNAFEEGDNLFDVTEWRYGTGGGVQWFSPFGPLMLVLGFPLNPTSIDDSPVFEFSVGGGGI